MEVSGQIHAMVSLPPGKELPAREGWVGFKAGLDTVKRKISCRTPAVQPIPAPTPTTTEPKLICIQCVTGLYLELFS
jgi:hypothetical protein